jgi:hypothetical protein
MKQNIPASPSKNVVAQFIGRASLSLRRAWRRSNLGGKATKLPRPDKSGQAMPKNKEPDESGNYKNLE